MNIMEDKEKLEKVSHDIAEFLIECFEEDPNFLSNVTNDNTFKDKTE
jgi:hypothetical protein